MKIQFIFIFGCLLFLFSTGRGIAQEQKNWSVKIGVHNTNAYFHYLSFPNSTTYTDTSGQFVGFGTGYGNGNFDYRLSNSLMIYKEKKYRYLSILFGVGYRQRGYLSAINYGIAYGLLYPDGINIKREVESRLHYLSTDLALKFKIHKLWYILLTSRFDILLKRKTSTEHEYISNSLKTLELSPALALGKEITFCDYTILIEFEVNRGLQNISKPIPTIQGLPSTKLWNMSYGLNLGIKF